MRARLARPRPDLARARHRRRLREHRRLDPGRLPRRGRRLPRALAAAPGQSGSSGETPISDCLAENQQGGDLATVGDGDGEAATKLNAEARAEPGGDANLQLGYLLGAAERGAEDTDGIHAELIRRLTRPPATAPATGRCRAPSSRAYREGFEAGERPAERAGSTPWPTRSLQYAARDETDGGDDID